MPFWRRDSAREVGLRGKSGAKKKKGAAPPQPDAQPSQPPSPTGIFSSCENDYAAEIEASSSIDTACTFPTNDDAISSLEGEGSRSRPVSMDDGRANELAEWELDASALRICTHPNGKQWVLGAGSFGRVLKAKLATPSREKDVAMKMTIISPEAARRRSLCDRLEQDFIREIALMKYLSNADSHVVPFHGACVYDGRLCLVLEYCAGGDLTQAIRTGGFGWFERGRSVALDVTRGLVFLHSKRVVHCDFKSKNILVTGDGAAKIADVGMSRMMHAGAGDHRGLQSDGSLGTFAWAAPEMLMGEDPTPAADIYSLGIVLWEICTGEFPRRGQRRVPGPQEAPMEVAALIHACLRFKAEERPTAQEVLEVLESLGEQAPPPAALLAEEERRKSAEMQAVYRQTIEDNARRRHASQCAAAACSVRQSVDVRRARELSSMEKSMQSLVAKSSSLYAPAHGNDVPRARPDGGSGRRRTAPRCNTAESAPAAASTPQPPAALYSSPFAAAPPPDAGAKGQPVDAEGRRRSISELPPQRQSLAAAGCQRSASMPMAGVALAMSSSLFAASPAASGELSPSLTPASTATAGSGQLPAVSELKAATKCAPSQREPTSVYNSSDICSIPTAPATVEPSGPRLATASGSSLGSGSKQQPLQRSSASKAAPPPRPAAPQPPAPIDLYSSFLLLSEATLAAAETGPLTAPEQAPSMQIARLADETHNPFAAAAAQRDTSAAT